MMARIEIYNQVINSLQDFHANPIIWLLLTLFSIISIITMLLDKALSPLFGDLFTRYRQHQEDDQKGKKVQQKMAFDIQKDLSLLNKFLNLSEESKLSKKWETCFTQNRSVWSDNALQTLLIQRAENVIQPLQEFYEGLDDFENGCKELIEVQARIRSLRQSKPMSAPNTFEVKEMVGVLLNPNSMTEEEYISMINMQKYIRMGLKDLKFSIPGLMEQGSYILNSLKVN